MSLTTKELMLIQDNIKMTENSISFMKACVNISTDTEVKNLCETMWKDHQNDLQVLAKHINSATIQ